MVEPVQIAPTAIYDDGSIRNSLGISPAALAAGRRDGTLRYSRKGKRIFYLGQWLIDWLGSDTTADDHVASGTSARKEAAPA